MGKKTRKQPDGMTLWRLGKSITVTILEVYAVRMWATVAMAAAEEAKRQGDPGADFMLGFLLGMKNDTDESIAFFIAKGKLTADENGERPLCAEFMETR